MASVFDCFFLIIAVSMVSTNSKKSINPSNSYLCNLQENLPLKRSTGKYQGWTNCVFVETIRDYCCAISAKYWQLLYEDGKPFTQ